MHIARLLRAGVMAAFLLLAPLAEAQESPWPEAEVLQTQLYFGLSSADGSGVSEQAWANFLDEVVTPRFPDGLTVVNAHGQWRAQAAPQPAMVLSEATKLLIIVHRNTDEAHEAIAQIKAIYIREFRQTSVFHVDFPVRVVE